MHCPVTVIWRDRLASARIRLAGRNLFHADAFFDWTDADTEIAADTLIIDHFKMPRAINHIGDRLMRGVLAGNMAAAAFDAAF